MILYYVRSAKNKHGLPRGRFQRSKTIHILVVRNTTTPCNAVPKLINYDYASFDKQHKSLKCLKLKHTVRSTINIETISVWYPVLSDNNNIINVIMVANNTVYHHNTCTNILCLIFPWGVRPNKKINFIYFCPVGEYDIIRFYLFILCFTPLFVP